MRSRDDAVPAHLAVERALDCGLCGMGGRLEPAPASLEQAVSLARRQHDDRLARRIGRFASVEDGAVVWTRDGDGLYWLGALDGPWRYDGTPDAAAVDLVHVRPCRWRSQPVAPLEAPAAVMATFARGGRNWQRIHSASAERQSQALLGR